MNMSSRLARAALTAVVLALVLLPLDMTSTGIPWSGLRSYGTLNLSRWLVIAIAAMGAAATRRSSAERVMSIERFRRRSLGPSALG